MSLKCLPALAYKNTNLNIISYQVVHHIYIYQTLSVEFSNVQLFIILMPLKMFTRINLHLWKTHIFTKWKSTRVALHKFSTLSFWYFSVKCNKLPVEIE